MRRYAYHKKTGNIYKILHRNATCTTNAYEGAHLIVYKRAFDTQCIYVRDFNEFWQKFRWATAREVIKAAVIAFFIRWIL